MENTCTQILDAIAESLGKPVQELSELIAFANVRLL